MTTTRVDLDEIQTTRAEKFLAYVLAAFLLVGGLWIYHRLSQNDGYYRPAVATPAEQGAIGRHSRDHQAVFAAGEAVRQRESQLVLAREAYRTALDAKQPAGRLERAYRQSETALAQSRQRLRSARRASAASAPAATRAERAVSTRSEHRDAHARRNTFLLRLGYVLAALAAAFFLLRQLRRRRSRYLLVGFAAVGAATVQALVMAGDYTTDYIDVGSSGPFLLSAAGIVLTLGSFVGLQRYLARRMPARRVRKHECPFCGFPVGDNSHCEGCGRAVRGECGRCSGPRRVGTPHCGVCGAV